MSAVASTSRKTDKFVNEAIDCHNVKLLNTMNLTTGVDPAGKAELRTSELTPLMVACIMGQFGTVKTVVE